MVVNSGIIIQHGHNTATKNKATNVVLPITFTVVKHVFWSHTYSSSNTFIEESLGHRGISTDFLTKFQIYNKASGDTGFDWFAIGY